MEIQGKIVHVLPLQSGVGKASGKEWKKQDYVLETLDLQYPKKVCFNLWGDNIDKFALQEGEEVTVQIDIESREYNGRWYTEVKAWRVDRGLVSLAAPAPQAAMSGAPMGGGYQAPAPAAPHPFTAPTAPAAQPLDSGNALSSADDLPF